MNQKVYILNDNDYPLKELFKGEEVLIKANDYWRTTDGSKKVLDLFEANDFRGQYHPVPFDGSGKMINDPKYWKKIKMEPVDGAQVVALDSSPTGYKCMAKECKHVSPSPEELDAHTKTRHSDLDRLVLPEEDVQIKAKKGK